MSNHFTYEIDERNVRVQLKGHKFETKEADWNRFQDQLSENISRRRGDVVADKFNITLNRNVVLPLIFGIIVITFSLLLVNFMSIKNNTNATKGSPAMFDKKMNPESSVVAKTTKIESVVQKETATVKPTNSNLTTDQQNAPAKKEEIIASGQPNIKEQVNTKQSPIGNSDSLNKTEFEKTATANEPSKRKRKVVDPSQTIVSPELQPTLVSEDNGSEERPE